MRRCPKPIVAMVAGYAVGGGHILHMVCDLTIAADNAVFGQTGPKVGSFDAGYGSTHMAAIIGQKKAREMWFLARLYDAKQVRAYGVRARISLECGCRMDMHCMHPGTRVPHGHALHAAWDAGAAWTCTACSLGRGCRMDMHCMRPGTRMPHGHALHASWDAGAAWTCTACTE
eukprot:366245-Chlamydomonas_euryale.AAC.34